MNIKYFQINRDGNNIRCKLYFSSPEYNTAIICCHGFAGHKDNKQTEIFAEKILNKNKNVCILSFDFPCHGDDVKKKLSIDDCVMYLYSVIDYAKVTLKCDVINVYSISFGAYIVLYYISISDNPFDKIILRSPAINLYDSFCTNILSASDIDKLNKNKPVYAGFDKKIEISSDFLNEIKINDIRNCNYIDFADKIYMIHGTSDEIIPIEIVSSFSDDNIIDLFKVQNADHRFQNPILFEQAYKNIVKFFNLN